MSRAHGADAVTPPGARTAAPPAPPAPEATTGGAPSPEQVTAALREVLDPEYPVSVVDLGLIRGVEVKGCEVRVRLTFTSMGCPCMELIQDDIVARLRQVPGVERVALEVTWEPWSRAHITEEGWRRLRAVGVV
ncbi:MAG: metal-sulfur cluster assembly factor [Armatimonadota bacterium]|nr:metal-sulfur cluster assembly factor [Armatimonadota bacterium]